MKELLRSAFRRAGYEVVNVRAPRAGVLPPDFSDSDARICLRVRPYTQTPAERVFCLLRALEHVQARGVPGAVVECGVWRGGSMMAAALALLGAGRADRDLVLFDTFDGMSRPTGEDEPRAHDRWTRDQRADGGSDWNRVPFDEVRANLLSTGYPEGRLRFVPGKVEDSLPGEAPASVAVLRLDLDLYAPTRHALEHLYPRLSPGGVLIVDDYGDFLGCRKAVDEYFASAPLLLNRIDSSARIAVKA